MKILIYSSNSIYSGKPVGGAEHSLSLLAKGLLEEGEEVHFLTREVGKRLSKSRIENIDGVAVHFLPNYAIPLQRISMLGRLNEWIFQWFLFFYLNKHFKNFDIAFGYNEYPDLYYILRWKDEFNLGIKTVIRVAGFYWHFGIGLKSDSQKRIITKVYNSVNMVNFISLSLERKYWSLNSEYNYGFNIQDSFVLDIGVPTPNIYPQTSSLLDFKIVMVSRFAQLSKNQKLLIKAFKAANISKATLILIGDGETKEALVSYCKKDDFLSTRVRFTGYINKNVVNQYLSNASLFCLCSDYEGVPKATLEAMYAGIPVLVSNIEAYKDIVIDNYNGFLAENEISEWSNRISEIYEQHLDGSLAEIVLNAKQFVTENYDYKKNTVRYIKVFNELIA
ncbi:glycosyltransferase family 4 protein [Roseivirga echinicomitans]